MPNSFLNRQRVRSRFILITTNAVSVVSTKHVVFFYNFPIVVTLAHGRVAI